MTDYGLCNQKHIFFFKKIKLKKSQDEPRLETELIEKRKKKKGGRK